MKNRSTAIILAIFFGWCGVHKFYLGKWFQGIIYIILMISTFGVLPLFLSLLEATTYGLNKKEWFDMKYNFEEMQKQDYMNKRKNNS